MTNKKTPWNKGLTKENNDIIKKMSEEQKGENNPIHKILNDPVKKEKWIDSIRKSGAYEKNSNRIRGKTLEEIHGKEKADEIKQNNSEWCKTGKPHKGHKHSEETKNILRRKTAEYNAEHRNKISSQEISFFEILKKEFSNERIESQFLFDFYTIDIAFPEQKIAIEVDGDFWHSNEAKGFFLKFPCQKRNKTNDEKKNLFLIENNWLLLRVWVSDLEKNLNQVIQKVEKHLCEKKKLLK